jgi:hypothetical protein
VLPKDDPWWNSHYPPNGWGCKCWTQAVSEAGKARLEKTGITVPPSVDGRPGYTVRVRTQAPRTTYRTFINNRTGAVDQVPAGVDPAFNWNVGRRGRNVEELQIKIEETRKKILNPPSAAETIKNIAGIKDVFLPKIPEEVQRGILEGYKKVLGRYPQLHGEFALLNDLQRGRRTYAACRPSNGSVFVNRKFFGNIAEIASAYENDVKKGWHPAGTDWRAVVVHEIGHRVHGILSLRYLTKTGEEIEKVIRRKALANLNLTPGDIGRELSMYAKSSASEFFAEAFAEYLTSKKPRRLAKEVGRLINLYMKGKLP